jgi:quercetin dioxygenase-like cupin family protein
VIALAFAMGLAAAAGVQRGDAHAPPRRTVVVDNATVTVTRLRFSPNAREEIHTHDFPVLIVQLTPGDVDLRVGDSRTAGRRAAGAVTYVPAATEHAAAHGGGAPFEMLAIAIKPGRPPAPAAPPTEALQRIKRTTLLDNDTVRVVRVVFEPGGREPIHAHPNDLVTVQLTPGRVGIRIGGRQTIRRRAVGFVQFLDRNETHAYESRDPKRFELLSVSVK